MKKIITRVKIYSENEFLISRKSQIPSNWETESPWVRKS
jgi:hypothetical protein